MSFCSFILFKNKKLSRHYLRCVFFLLFFQVQERKREREIEKKTFFRHGQLFYLSTVKIIDYGPRFYGSTGMPMTLDSRPGLFGRLSAQTKRNSSGFGIIQRSCEVFPLDWQGAPPNRYRLEPPGIYNPSTRSYSNSLMPQDIAGSLNSITSSEGSS